jgi:integrase
MVEDLRSIIEHLPRYSSSDGGPTGRLTLTALRDRALLLVGWTGALRRSELAVLTTEDVQFIEGEGVNVYVRRSKSDQEGTGIEGLAYGSGQETCPVTALRPRLLGDVQPVRRGGLGLSEQSRRRHRALTKAFFPRAISSTERARKRNPAFFDSCTSKTYQCDVWVQS